jgi:hypothetical protein
VAASVEDAELRSFRVHADPPGQAPDPHGVETPRAKPAGGVAGLDFVHAQLLVGSQPDVPQLQLPRPPGTDVQLRRREAPRRQGREQRPFGQLASLRHQHADGRGGCDEQDQGCQGEATCHRRQA